MVHVRSTFVYGRVSAAAAVTHGRCREHLYRSVSERN